MEERKTYYWDTPDGESVGYPGDPEIIVANKTGKVAHVRFVVTRCGFRSTLTIELLRESAAD